jgi:cytochrome c556
LVTEDLRVRGTTLTIGAAGAMLFIASCTPAHEGAGGGGRVGPLMGGDGAAVIRPRPGEHWVQNERLRAVMAQISRQAGRWPAGVPSGPEAARPTPAQAEADEAFGEAAGLADGLAEAAGRIPRSVADHPMSAEDRRGFAAEAERLRGQALTLRRAARARRVALMQRAFGQIGATCASCHGQYKEFAGEMGPG